MGNSTNFSLAAPGNPSASADSFISTLISLSPEYVFLTMGSKLYRKSATIEGLKPIPRSGIINTSRAMEGIVCITPTILKIILPAFLNFQHIIPRGMANIIAKKSDINTSTR